MAWRPPLPETMPVRGQDTRQHLPEWSLGAVAGPPAVAIAGGLSTAQKGRVWTLMFEFVFFIVLDVFIASAFPLVFCC